jgi:hypothetical protein
MESMDMYLARTIPSLFISDKKCDKVKVDSIDEKIYFGCSLKKFNEVSKLYEPCNCSNYNTCQIYNQRS